MTYTVSRSIISIIYEKNSTKKILYDKLEKKLKQNFNRK